MAKGKTFDDFKKSHDETTKRTAKIKAAIAELDGWEYERDFCRKFGLPSYGLERYREIFSSHVVAISGTGRGRIRFLWCGSAKLATQIRKQIKGTK